MSSYTLPAPGTHFITLAAAVAMTTLYRNEREQILLPEYRGKNLLCTSETFALSDLNALLQEPGCAGFRIYYGMKEDKTVHAILVGTDSAGNDLLPTVKTTGEITAKNDDDDSLILQEGQRCPPLCPDPSPLNS